jgi:hypothetical protein
MEDLLSIKSYHAIKTRILANRLGFESNGMKKNAGSLGDRGKSTPPLALELGRV